MKSSTVWHGHSIRPSLPAGTARKASASLPRGRQSRLITPPAKRNSAFPTGNALLYISLSHVDFSGCVLFRGAPCFLFCLISPCFAVLFSLPTDCKRRRSPRTPRTQTTLFRSKISNALMTQSSLLARREFFRTSPHYKSAPIRSFCDFEQRASPKNHQKVELHKTSLQSCRVLL